MDNETYEIIFIEQSELPMGRLDTETVVVRMYDPESGDDLSYVVYQRPHGATGFKRTFTSKAITRHVGNGISLTGRTDLKDSGKLDRSGLVPTDPNVHRTVLDPTRFSLELHDDGRYATLHERDNTFDAERHLLEAIETFLSVRDKRTTGPTSQVVQRARTLKKAVEFVLGI